MPEISYLLAVPVSQSDRTDVNKRTFVICLRRPAVRSEERLPAIINNSFDKVISGLAAPT